MSGTNSKFTHFEVANQSRVRVEKQIRSIVATSKLRQRKSEVGNVRHLFHLLSNFTSTTKSFLHSSIMSSSPLPVADSAQGKQQSNKRARLHLPTNPLIFHTDNGWEFVSKIVYSELLRMNPGIVMVTGRPYTPSDRGSVERGNQDVKRTGLRESWMMKWIRWTIAWWSMCGTRNDLPPI